MKCADCNVEMIINSIELTDNKDYYWIEYECPECGLIDYEEKMA